MIPGFLVCATRWMVEPLSNGRKLGDSELREKKMRFDSSVWSMLSVQWKLNNHSCQVVVGYMNLELRKLISWKCGFERHPLRNTIESHGLGENTQGKNYKETLESGSLGHSQIKSYEDGGKASKKMEKEDQWGRRKSQQLQCHGRLWPKGFQ